MSQPIAKKGDLVVGVDTHVVLVPSPGGPVPTPMPFPFNGPIQRDLSSSVFVDNQAVALVGSGADNQPAHIPMGGQFQSSPSNQATVKSGSPTVFVDNRAIARANDPADCCNDPADQVTGHIVAVATVKAG